MFSKIMCAVCPYTDLFVLYVRKTKRKNKNSLKNQIERERGKREKLIIFGGY